MLSTRIFLAVALLAVPSLGFADTGYFCEIALVFTGDIVGDKKYNDKQYELTDCEKGDVIQIIISDEDNSRIETIFLAAQIIQICDNTLPVTIVGEGRAVCTYRGSRRKIRPG